MSKKSLLNRNLPKQPNRLLKADQLQRMPPRDVDGPFLEGDCRERPT